MKKIILQSIICASAAILFAGVATGTYFLTGLANNRTTENGNTSGEGPVKPVKVVNASTLFDKEGVKSEDEFTGFDDENRIKYGSKLVLNDESTAFYYELVNFKAEYDIIRFAIGIQNNAVTKLKTIELLDGHSMGKDDLDEHDAFIGYSLGGDEVIAGMTCEYTYSSVKKAIDLALKDCQRR